MIMHLKMYPALIKACHSAFNEFKLSARVILESSALCLHISFV